MTSSLSKLGSVSRLLISICLVVITTFKANVAEAAAAVPAAPAIIESETWQKIGLLRPYEQFKVFFKINSALDQVIPLGNATWQEENGWTASVLSLSKINQTHVGFIAPQTVIPLAGVHTLRWYAPYGELSATFEISCSDGIICNGMERLVYRAKGKEPICRSTKRELCDDRVACTDDFCREEDGHCSHVIKRGGLFNKKNCPDCKGDKCKLKCKKNQECGPDGCGGLCGPPCSVGYCIDGTCQDKDLSGTCNVPVDLTSEAQALNWVGTFTVTGDTKTGVDTVIPQCNSASTATEIMHIIRVPNEVGFVGIDARVQAADGSISGLDTVIQLIEVDPETDTDTAAACRRATTDTALVVACADDSSPPGGLSSRVTWMLKPGYVYYVHVDGYSEADVGPFLLTIRLTPECTLSCQGKLCGDSGCSVNGVPFPCGECKDGGQCSADGLVCVAPNCKPKCKKSPKKCGADGCGGLCGTCDSAKGEFCLEGLCQKFPACSPFLPKCTYAMNGKRFKGCAAGQYCSSDCKCRNPDDPLPDLALAEENVIPEIVEEFTVEPSSCALQEGCFNQPGKRRIVKFATDVFNQGAAFFNPPNPPESRPDLYEWASCHGHYHFQQFAKFELLDLNNNTIVEGQKRSYCAVDSHKHWVAHPKMPCTPRTTCAIQGISIGWLDSYGPNLDCQFMDITDVPSGNYFIKQCANFERLFAEATFENNCVKTPFFLPPKTGRR